MKYYTVFFLCYVILRVKLFPDTIFLPQAPEDQLFKATFKVVKGDVFSSELTDTNSTKFKNTSRNYKERLNLLFRRSPVKNGFIGSDVLALDGYVLFFES